MRLSALMLSPPARRGAALQLPPLAESHAKPETTAKATWPTRSPLSLPSMDLVAATYRGGAVAAGKPSSGPLPRPGRPGVHVTPTADHAAARNR